MARLVVRPAEKPLTGSVPVPSDRSIGHRALILAALSGGRSVLRGFSYGEKNVRTLRALAQLGVAIEDDGKGTLGIQGRGLGELSPPPGPIDCGSSGTTMRLLAGVLAAQPFRTTLTGDAALSRRPMAHVARTLRARGASVEGALDAANKDEITAPLQLGPLQAGTPGARLMGIEYRMPTSSSQVKGALLLSGLYASQTTTIYEPTISRDHTERMLSALGIRIGVAGTLVNLEPPEAPDAIPAFEADLPGDLSAAAFLLAAAALVPGSLVSTRRTGINPTRAGIVDVIRAFQGVAGAEPQGNVLGEPFGIVSAKHAELRATTIAGELATRTIDDVPVAAALAARARGVTEFSDVGAAERTARIVALLRAFGVAAEERADGFAVEGNPGGRLRAARVASGGDPAIAMTASVLGLVGDGETVVEDADCIAGAFPRFAGTLRALGARIEVAS